METLVLVDSPSEEAADGSPADGPSSIPRTTGLKEAKEEDDVGSSHSSEGSALRNPGNPREKLRRVLASTPYQVGLTAAADLLLQVAVVGLVLLDALLVVAVMLLDMDEGTSHSLAPVALHGLSLALLCAFAGEVLLKAYAHGLRRYFAQKAEVFDGVVVTVALSLDAVYLDAGDAHVGFGLLIVLRLWRVVRIQNAMVLQARRVSEVKLKRERQRSLALQAQLDIARGVIAGLQDKVDAFRIGVEGE